jgi:hypothetical protein
MNYAAAKPGPSGIEAIEPADVLLWGGGLAIGMYFLAKWLLKKKDTPTSGQINGQWHTECANTPATWTDETGNVHSGTVPHRHPLGNEYTEVCTEGK